ncbi:hypothetical protein L2E82_47931 [Cichorium intybus]|uniref:Uncharacterized protein n=1 Tax=Cichorium intybus TaxID=13427 RepID=A0ACB8YX41_CICIN|nr:hypothetical protein L2E82_47931 [Cichorium intybus]
MALPTTDSIRLSVLDKLINLPVLILILEENFSFYCRLLSPPRTLSPPFAAMPVNPLSPASCSIFSLCSFSIVKEALDTTRVLEGQWYDRMSLPNGLGEIFSLQGYKVINSILLLS